MRSNRTHEDSVHDLRAHIKCCLASTSTRNWLRPPFPVRFLRPMPAFYQRFQESARKFPNNIALEIQRQQTVERVTFAELTRMSERVANWLSTRVPRDAR